MNTTNNIADRIVKELNVDTAFTIPIFGGIDITESVVITWVVMAVLVLLSMWLTHDLKVDHISKRQAAAEAIVTGLQNFVSDILGPNGKPYVEYLSTVLLYIGLSNIIGMFGMKSPTKDLNVTAALAIMSIVLVEVAGIRKRGVRTIAHASIIPLCTGGESGPSLPRTSRCSARNGKTRSRRRTSRYAPAHFWSGTPPRAQCHSPSSLARQTHGRAKSQR